MPGENVLAIADREGSTVVRDCYSVSSQRREAVSCSPIGAGLLASAGRKTSA
jgi:hypothetical protein